MAIPTVSRVNETHAAELLSLQREAYQSEAAIYQDWTIAPLTETEDQFRQALQKQHILAAWLDGSIVGSIRAELIDTTCQIGRLFVAPQMQGRGIGRQLLLAAETVYSSSTRFQLFTGNRSAKNLKLYERLGYIQTHERFLNDKITLAVLEKQKLI
ncbi:GNAT family N-acetyltransferase [Roseibium sp.]|uniref:GNAT family N-acetyltransferase n=1 Tax=Roseibium sp. TaxID=1936156 RepID=UPI003BAFA595